MTIEQRYLHTKVHRDVFFRRAHWSNDWVVIELYQRLDGSTAVRVFAALYS